MASVSSSADSARNRRHVGRPFHRSRVDVAEQAVVGAVHPDVDHGRAFLDHVRRHEVDDAGGGDEDVGLERLVREVGRA